MTRADALAARVAALRRAGQLAARDNDPEVVEVGRTLLTFADGRTSGSLDEALGLRSSPGQESWRTELNRQTRDDLIRRYADTFIAADTLGGRAREVHRRLARYGSGQWHHDKDKYRCPYVDGDERAHLWAIFRQQARVSPERGDAPLAAATIKQLIRD
jgi:hypothetical protein